MEGKDILVKAYSDYTEKFLGYDDVPTFEEFRIDVLSGGPLSYYMGINVSKKTLTMEERWKLFEKMGHLKNLDLIDWVPTEITQITYNFETGELI